MRSVNFLKRFLKREDGASAVEFALVSFPFTAFLIAMIESGILYFAQLTLDNAVIDVARLVRTGQVQENGVDAIAFRAEICDRISALMNCDARLQVDVRTFANFNGVAVPDPVDADGNWNAPFNFDPGAAGDIVLVRVFYKWSSMTGMMTPSLENLPDGTHILTAGAAFRNEPFGQIVAE